MDPPEVYRLRPGDVITLQVYREPQVSGRFTLDASGNIRHPLCGVLSAAGLTIEEMEAHFTEILGEKFLVNPIVVASVVSSRSSQVVVLGEVARIGSVSVPFGGSLTLLQAIAEAGGFTGLASKDRVTITRTVNGKETSIRVRVSKLISGQKPDFELKPNDVIMVPQILF